MVSIKKYIPWKSPIAAGEVARFSQTPNLLKITGDCLHWLDNCSKTGCQSVKGIDLRTNENAKILTPSGWNIRTRVHEYGGGDYDVFGDVIFFVRDKDQQVYRQSRFGTHAPQVLTPDVRGQSRYADFTVTPDGKWLIAVRETREQIPGGQVKVNNDLVAIPTDGSLSLVVLVSGKDFFSYPRVSHDGDYLAWICWSHPHMPWDQTELWVGRLKQSPVLHLEGEACIAQGQQAISQPSWHADSGLYFISDASGWWNLYVWEKGQIRPICPMAADCGYPPWVFSTQNYAFLQGGQIVVCASQEGEQQLGIIEGNRFVSFELPFNYYVPTFAAWGQRICFVAGNATQFPQLRLYDAHNGACQLVESEAKAPEKEGVGLETVSMGPERFLQEYISLPQALRYPVLRSNKAENITQTVYGFFYKPHHVDYQMVEKPPLLVMVHGGPTGAAAPVLNLKVQFWTTRGFAVLEVNYSGSTGYGRAYRDRLKGQWGMIDVQDCVAGAQYAIDQGWVAPDRVVIRGASAGGFTALHALAGSRLFKAAACYYPVTDLRAMAEETHKFEAYYLEWLVGLDEGTLYRDRSPRYLVDQFSGGVILFQGLLDPIVSPQQTSVMVEAIRKKGLPCYYKIFVNEGHGLRLAPHVAQALEEELSFYTELFNSKPI